MTIEADLEWFMGIGMTKFVRSPFGAMLERQWMAYADPPAGQDRGGNAPHGWRAFLGRNAKGQYTSDPLQYNQPGGMQPDVNVFAIAAGPSYDQYTGRSIEHDNTYVPLTWQYAYVGKGYRDLPPEPELIDLHRFGRVSGRLYRMEKTEPLQVSALMAYHGDRGARWGRERPGEGRLLAVYPLTYTGAKWVAHMKDTTPVELNMLRDDERIASECAAQDKKATDIRRARLKRIEQEAREVIHRSHDAYRKAAA